MMYQTSATPPAARTRPRMSRRTAGLIQSGFLILIALVSLVPVLAIVFGTFQDGNDVIRNGISFSTDWSTLSFDNYVMLFTDSGLYFQWFWNSLVLTVVQLVGTLLVSSFVAYGFAMYEFRGKSLGFILVIILMTIPFEMLMLPLYVQVNDMRATDQYWIVVLPFLAQAVTIFFFRQYFLGIPKEILEAGRMDGVSEFGIFFRLVAPIAKPAFAAMAILNSMIIWNNFLWPLLVLRSPDKFILPIGLNTLLTPYGNNYELLIIGSFFSLIPLLILFLAFQRFFVQGMTAGAVKG
ncbi:carbohydrate ABC transporter permease [Microbacterium sp. KSW4-16]|uniref:Carbohydrate ABC transporter permease n=1 Tax=Microbacterium aurugineum TaxID=2851642 RepID=A0ABY4IV01_9MICO|nr:MULTISPECIES: carbohydrate ABC transporter permease [Microbacterium]MCK8468863.1 carbohydrate ABC transporter permease [Microbacterium aurugineum]MCZ4301911.1 carbohydrate ABC transporter permease [Microbacterium oxydans]QEA27498.1 carbohydrate ABC transporter permease [Microbacterium sp. CBA3102]TCJ21693.1 carbohydrate ABC transporter permease [Microbacterium sp. PI-1]UPL16607.1 carbohydrate ABC transporter permease [Microbacterium aurugineum]